MGYQDNPFVFAFDEFIPDPMTPLDIVIGQGIEIYVPFLFGNVTEESPPGLLTGIQGNTVGRFEPGHDGVNMGRVEGYVSLDFQNLGTPVEFTAAATAGFDLNTMSEVETFRREKTYRASNQNPFVSLSFKFFTTLYYSAVVGAGKTHIELAVRLRHSGTGSRTIRVGLSSSSVAQLGRLSRDATP